MDFSAFTVLCVGDVILDHYVVGDVSRLSPEASVPVLEVFDRRTSLGGVGNVARNIASLGGRAILVGLVGNDQAGHEVRSLLAGSARIMDAHVPSPLRPTTCKTRYLAGRGQLIRVDEEDTEPARDEEECGLLEAIDRWIDKVDAVILSDYAKAVLTPQIIAACITRARQRGISVFVDPKCDDFRRYHGATCITPNLKELGRTCSFPVDGEQAIIRAARDVMQLAESNAVLVTRSEQGMTLVESDGAVHSVSARVREQFDVTGAGDTVIAAMTLAHTRGQSLAGAMRVANAAAGVAVSKSGTATVEPKEVVCELAGDDGNDTVSSTIPSLAVVEALVASWKASGLSVGFTNGCFDVLHGGHVALLAQAKAECDRLIVALNTDASVRRLKGPDRPVNKLQSRAALMASIRHVDSVVAFGEDTPETLIALLLPDVLLKGADYKPDEVVGGDLVRANGGRVILVDLVPQQSTSRTIGRIRSRSGMAQMPSQTVV